MRTFLRIPSHYVVAKTYDTLVSRLKNQCAHGRSQYCNSVAAPLLFEFAVDLRSRHDHFRQMSCYPVDCLATMLEQVCLMCFPYVYYAKTVVRSAMNTYTQIDFSSWQTECRHVWNRAEAETTIWVRDKRVFFEFEQFRQERIQSQNDGR